MRNVRDAAGLTIVGAAGYLLMVSGQLTLDTGIGRRLRPLGPHTVSIGADRDTVFDVIASPYLGRTSRALSAEIEVLERSEDMVLAAHRTPVAGGRLTTTTVETVRFEPPHTVSFRLVRGPVPHVVERFTLDAGPGSTRLDYAGEMGTDFWGPGAAWGDLVARSWEATVQDSLERIRGEAERRAGALRRR
jgi:hypothetical protein